MTQDAGRGRQWFGFGEDPKLVQEWLRQNNLIYGGLIAIGVYLGQPFLTASSLDLTARTGARPPGSPVTRRVSGDEPPAGGGRRVPGTPPGRRLRAGGP